jgi:hypothetical protein
MPDGSSHATAGSANGRGRRYDRLGFQTVSSDGLYLLKVARRLPAID